MKRRYYYLVERELKDVNGAWRAVQGGLFICIMISSAIGCNFFNNTFDTFNYRCVLYAKLTFTLTDVEYFNATKPPPPLTGTTKPPGENSDLTENAVVDNVTETNTKNNIKDPKEGARVLPHHLIEDADSLLRVVKPRIKDGREKIPTIERRSDEWIKIEDTPDTYIYENEIWLKNATLIGKINIDMMKTVFATLLTCDYVLFAGMLSILVSAFFAGLVLYCVKGGRGRPESGGLPQPYRYVPVVVIASVTMVILCGIADNIVDKGFGQFCERCQRWTGEPGCSGLMNYFTTQQMMGLRPFYFEEEVCRISHLITIWLWVIQLLLTCLRMLLMTDFEFRTIFIQKKTKHTKEIDTQRDEAEFVDLSTGKYALFEVYRELKEKSKLESKAEASTSTAEDKTDDLNAFD